MTERGQRWAGDLAHFLLDMQAFITATVAAEGPGGVAARAVGLRFPAGMGVLHEIGSMVRVVPVACAPAAPAQCRRPVHE